MGKGRRISLTYLLSTLTGAALILGTGHLLATDPAVQVQSDGTKVVHEKDGTVVEVKADGTKVIKKADGTMVEVKADGTKTIKKPNGENVEIKMNPVNK